MCGSNSALKVEAMVINSNEERTYQEKKAFPERGMVIVVRNGRSDREQTLYEVFCILHNVYTREKLWIQLFSFQLWVNSRID